MNYLDNTIKNYYILKLNQNKLFEINNLINETSILIYKSNIILSKIYIILEEWFNYKLLNKTDNLIFQSNNLISEILALINNCKDTLDIYKNVGSIILFNIPIIFYTLIVILIILTCLQIVICIFIFLIHKNNKKILKLKKESLNDKKNHLTYNL